jgi:hypothetical protein
MKNRHNDFLSKVIIFWKRKYLLSLPININKTISFLLLEIPVLLRKFVENTKEENLKIT